MNAAQPLPRAGVVTLLRAFFKPASGLPAESRLVLAPTAFRLRGLSAPHLQRYRDALGFSGAAIPLTYCYLLAQRVQLATMLGEAFPLRIPGMIHVENELVEHAQAEATENLLLTTSGVIEPARSGGARICVLETVAEQNGQPVFTCRSTYLSAAAGARRRSPRTPQAPAEAQPPIAAWRLGPTAGLRYAALSGDWNPIHLGRWPARLLGFDKPIIHGMHTVGKACALLEARTGRRIVRIAVRFLAPVPLESEPRLEADLQAGTFAVRRDTVCTAHGSFEAR